MALQGPERVLFRRRYSEDIPIELVFSIAVRDASGLLEAFTSEKRVGKLLHCLQQ